MPSIGFWLWTLALIAIAIVALILVYPIVNKPKPQAEALPGLSLAQSEHVRKGYPL